MESFGIDPMSTATATTKTVTLTNAQWEAIRCATLCFACDERSKGNGDAADHFLAAYLELKAALG